MKKIVFPILILLSSLTAGAQQRLGVEQSRAEKREDSVYLHTMLHPADLALHRQQLLTVTPVLRSTDRAHQLAFAPVAVAGKTRLRAIERSERLNGVRLDPVPSQLIRYDKNSLQAIHFILAAAYQPWMQDAELVLVEQVTGCRNERVSDSEYRVISPVLAVTQAPAYRIAYAEPPTEAVKQRSESYAARINFTVNRYDIRRDYMNNAAVLDEVDRIIDEVHQDANLTLTRFHVTGYASPEGSAAANLTLSENRAKAFVDYVQSRHDLPRNLVQVDWRGDDWDGLRKLMDGSAFADRFRVLDILGGTSDPQQRKNRLRALPSYATLLNEYYPSLRRNDYTIGYIARAFDVEEARTLIHTKPQYLSLNEMYLVANTYPKDSREFKEVFDIAARMYPDDDYANLNSAALDIEHGALDTALERSLRVDRPEAWNNIGYIYVQKQDYARAAEYFKRAADAGLTVAADNLRQLNTWLANR